MYLHRTLRPYYPYQQRKGILRPLFKSIHELPGTDQIITYEGLLQQFGTYDSFITPEAIRRQVLPTWVVTLIVIAALTVTAASGYHIYTLFHSAPAYYTETFYYIPTPEVIPNG